MPDELEIEDCDSCPAYHEGGGFPGEYRPSICNIAEAYGDGKLWQLRKGHIREYKEPAPEDCPIQQGIVLKLAPAKKED